MKRENYLKCALTTVIMLVSVLFVSTASFAAGLDDIRLQIAKKGAKWKADITSMHKLDEKQKKMRASLIMPTGAIAPTTTASSTGMLSAPSGAFDWRDHGGTNYVTPIKDQGNCGSCWAFASTAALESYALMNGMYDINRNLSEQILVSCSSAGSCNGGYLDSAATFIESTGLPAESFYPYTATNGSCSAAGVNWRNATNKIIDWQWITKGNADIAALKDAVYTYGPIVVTMTVYDDFFWYRSGIYSHTGGSLAGYHAVTVVGYADDSSVAGGGYFIVKNSWGNGWGEGFGNDQGGYFRIEYDEATSQVCFGGWSIAYVPTAATCYYGFSQSSATAVAGATSSSVGITSGAASCIWHVRSNVPWLTVSTTDGKGSGQISYSVAANSSSTSRTGTITLFDATGSVVATFTVNQVGQAPPPPPALPVINSFAVTTLSNSLTIPITAFKASGPKPITGYQITTSSIKPTTGWRSTAPGSVTVTGQGKVTLYAWAKDSAGAISAPVTATVNVDTIKPVVSTFTVAATSSSMTVPISVFSATDSNSGITGYLVTNTATAPAAAASGWLPTPPAAFTATSSGTKTIYAWARDAAGNVSIAKTATVKIDTTPPTVTAFAVPATSNTLSVAVTTFTATDNIGVTGKLVTESSTKPLASATGWAAAPASYTVTTPGTKTLYAWARDAAGNVSNARVATITVTVVNPVVNTVAPLPKTGQTTCYDMFGNTIPCLGTGQDGDLRIGINWPNPRFADNGDQTITDKLTGLVWTKNAFPAAINKSWQDALNYIKSLNTSNYLGHNDWRLPNNNELVSLSNQALLPPNTASIPNWLSNQGFVNVQMNYWSSSTRIDAPNYAMMVSLASGVGYGFSKVNNYYTSVWPVRTGTSGSAIVLPQTGQTSCYDTNGAVIVCKGTGQDGELQSGVKWPSLRFVGNSDQTMTDTLTGLSWAKDVNSAATTKTWQDALNYVKSLNSSNYLGHNDWRLPNRNELMSLFNAGQANNATWLNSQGFANVKADFYWSSSTIVSPQRSFSAFAANMSAGFVSVEDKTRAYYAWPVRGGR